MKEWGKIQTSRDETAPNPVLKNKNMNSSSADSWKVLTVSPLLLKSEHKTV